MLLFSFNSPVVFSTVFFSSIFVTGLIRLLAPSIIPCVSFSLPGNVFFISADVSPNPDISGSMLTKSCIPALPTVCTLGTRLKLLSIANGQTSLMAASAHRQHIIFLGAFLKTNRRSTMAKTSQLADILMSTIL